ncbi:hypothetical protein Tco_0990976, partial [Tanacetum coccineum]
MIPMTLRLLFPPWRCVTFKVIQRIGEVAYKLELPSNSQIHNVFYASQLKKCRHLSPDQACGKLPPCDLSGVFLVEPLAILYHMMAKKGNGIEIYVLVQCTNGTTEDATWELIMSYNPNFQILIVQLKDKLFSKEGGLISHTSSDKLVTLF